MIVGLTGGVASGKSLVSEELERLGAIIIDADSIAREIASPGTDVYGAIVREFGRGILAPDGSIDRRALGSIVFSDPGKLKRLNLITHPPIMRRIVEELEACGKKHPASVIVVDAPLLIEVGLHRSMDKVIVVYTDEDKQLERLKKKSGLTEEEAKNRINAQLPLSRKLEYADYVIDNNGTLEETLKEAQRVYSELNTQLSAQKEN